jgi:hypothetical protein
VGREAEAYAGLVGAANDDHSPAVVEEAFDQVAPVLERPSLGRSARTKVDGKERSGGSKAAGVESVGVGF